MAARVSAQDVHAGHQGEPGTQPTPTPEQSTTDLGLRLRYEFRRETAPYVGVTWSSEWGKTADFAEAAGEHLRGARFIAGLRLWF